MAVAAVAEGCDSEPAPSRSPETVAALAHVPDTLADQVTQQQWADKYREAQETGTRATKLELAGSYDAAFTAYLSAAQTYLFLVRNTTDSDIKVKLRAVSGKLVERAERIKAARKKDIKSIRRDPLSVEEQDAVLEKGASVGGIRLRRWREEGSAGDGPPPPLPPLSPAQRAVKCSWVRCTDVLPGAEMIAGPVCGEDIVQDNVSDCSVVAALILAAQHHARYDSKIGLSCLYPQDESGMPKISPTGRYSARLLVNGTWRRLDLDDSLPVSSEGRPMCASTRRHDQLWPPLIEKAYLTLMGGYDFSGSNSANDLYAMSGWIPESISLRSGFRGESTWQRIRSGFSLGHCLLSVGTGKYVDGEPAHSGLVPSHNYVVSDVREKHGVRQLVLINPWRTTESTESTWTAGLRQALGEAEGPQTLVVAWDALPARFASLHVNWDPTVFDHTDTAHSSAPNSDWTAIPCASSKHRHSIHLRLQIEPNPCMPSEVWLLLARHTSSPLEKGEYIGIAVSECADATSGPDQRLRLDEGSSMHDNLYDLHRFLPEVGATAYDLVVAHEGAAADFAFTLRAFSNSRVKIVGGPAPLPYVTSGSWTTSTAGGNHTCHTFLNNPQYAVKVAPLPGSPGAKAMLEIVGETGKNSPINVKLIYRNGARVADFESRDVLAGASTYAYGRDACSAREVPPGSYTLVVSSFQPRHLADFSLAVRSSLPVEVASIPPEGAGMYARQIKGTWREGRDGGKGDLRRNPRFVLRVSRSTSVQIRLQTPAEPRAIAISLFSSSPSGEAGRLIASSGAYTDAVCGTVLPLTRLEPAAHDYLVVPSTFHAGVHADFVLLSYADAPVTLALVEEGQ